MNYSHLKLYVMSGTGNTYRFAHWIKETAGQKGIDTDIEMIDDVSLKKTPTSINGTRALKSIPAKKKQKIKDKVPNKNTTELIGVLFPAHGLMAPWSMIKFLFCMPLGKKSPAICAATRGGIKMGPIIIPGAVGIGTFLAALILFLKGYRIKAIFSMDMPVNFINLHWGMHPENVDVVLKKTRKKLSVITDQILYGKKILFTRNNLWELAWGALLFWLIPLFPIIYLFIARIYMGKLMFANNQCVGCGLCAKFCPNEGVIMKKIRGKKYPYWTYHCEACLRCMGFCKKKAIEAGHSWAILLYFITSIPAFTWISIKINTLIPLFPVIEDYWLNQLFNIIYFFPSIILSYWIFWRLIKIPILNTLFTYTTLTRYFRRYHEPETKLKHLKKTKKKI